MGGVAEGVHAFLMSACSQAARDEEGADWEGTVCGSEGVIRRVWIGGCELEGTGSEVCLWDTAWLQRPGMMGWHSAGPRQEARWDRGGAGG